MHKLPVAQIVKRDAAFLSTGVTIRKMNHTVSMSPYERIWHPGWTMRHVIHHTRGKQLDHSIPRGRVLGDNLGGVCNALLQKRLCNFPYPISDQNGSTPYLSSLYKHTRGTATRIGTQQILGVISMPILKKFSGQDGLCTKSSEVNQNQNHNHSPPLKVGGGVNAPSPAPGRDSQLFAFVPVFSSLGNHSCHWAATTHGAIS